MGDHPEKILLHAFSFDAISNLKVSMNWFMLQLCKGSLGWIHKNYN